VGTGPFEFVEWKQTEAVKGKKFDGYWKKGYPKVESVSWKPVLENNTRAAMLQTGEADFAFPLPYEQVELLKKSDKVNVAVTPSIITRSSPASSPSTCCRSPMTTPRCAKPSPTPSTRKRWRRWPSAALQCRPRASCRRA
jgi:hypothetical protein